MSLAYYNEFDEQTAAWLRELIKQGHIAPGDVDTRSIEDVKPDDLRDYTQCHFFAGIGVWSYALRRAGWPDDRPIWTGSCPCQPFSAAGKGAAFDDERHLWPAFHHLIKVGRPAIVLGEQVASSPVDDWIDLVHADVEALGYAFGSVPFPSAGVGAPHIRDRNYWVANANGTRSLPGAHARVHRGKNGAGSRYGEPERQGATGGLANDHQHGRAAHAGAKLHDSARHVEPRGDICGLGNPAGATGERHTGSISGAQTEIDRQGFADGRIAVGLEYAGASLDTASSGPTNGYWADADWLGCRDGKWRPVEPGTFPLAHGSAARVVRLRGYGNAINAEQAKIWIETVMECIA